MWKKLFPILACGLISACDQASRDSALDFVPVEVIDLGALITEDTAQRVAGQGFLEFNGINRPNQFELVTWTVEMPGGDVSGSNAFYTLANHGGPHVDAPNHVGLEGGIDSYPIEVFSGPLKVFDVSSYPKGFSIPQSVFRSVDVDPGDIVLIYTDYAPPHDETSFPETVTLTRHAAQYLAEIPIRAIATDAYSVANLQDQANVASTDVTALAVPIHHSFLSRGIPVYEQLFNVEKLLEKKRMYFSGVPLNIRDGDGMIVRPVVYVY
jgi:kynurenine formamidase